MDDELEGAGKLGLQRHDIDLAVALPGVAVSGFEEGSFGADGNEEGAACDQLLVVHVAGVGAGRAGADLACFHRGGETHVAEEGVKRDGDVRGESAGHLFSIERNDPDVRVGEFCIEKATFEIGIAGPGNVDVHFFYANLEDVAGLGLLDGDGTRENVTAGAAFGGWGHVVEDIADVVRNVGGGNTTGLQTGGCAARGEGLDDDRVAGLDRKGRLGLGPEVSPYDGGGRDHESVSLLSAGRRREERGSAEEGGAEQGGAEQAE
jgi:hypothetical protein